MFKVLTAKLYYVVGFVTENNKKAVIFFTSYKYMFLLKKNLFY